MITIDINGESRRLETGNPEPWLEQKIDARMREGSSVCVKVDIERPGVRVLLSTCDCAPSGGGWRNPNPDEAEILSQWKKHGLTCNRFLAKDLLSFLRSLRSS